MQTFNIEIKDLDISKELISSLLRQYFADMKFVVGNIVVEEIPQGSTDKQPVCKCNPYQLENYGCVCGAQKT